jgi:hypothetical protein
MSLKDILEKHFPDTETIDGTRVADVVEHVMLEVADSPVLPYETADPLANPPTPAKATKLESGDYWVDGVRGVVSADTLKRMRGRFLLTRGLFYKHLGTLPHSMRQQIVAQYFDGAVWVPQAGSAMATAMGVL